MKRLLGLLLVMGMVGCGGGSSHKGETASPATFVTTPAQVADADPVNSLKKLGAQIEQDDQGRVVELNLSSTQITDAGLVHLKGLTTLQQLNLNGTKVTDAGVVEVPDLQLAAPWPGANPADAPSAAGAGPAPGHTPPRQSRYWWRLDTPTGGAEHETSAGS